MLIFIIQNSLSIKLTFRQLYADPILNDEY